MSLTTFAIPGMALRPEQKQILAEMEELVLGGARNIIVSAPTGVGKSLIAKAVASVLGPAWIVTSTKHLQDQYAADFHDIKTIKGMTNFPCLQLMGKKEVKDGVKAVKDKLTCDRGQCSTRIDKNTVVVCPHKEAVTRAFNGRPESVMAGLVDDHFDPTTPQCHYYEQRAVGLRARQAALNYALYFNLMAKQSDVRGVDRPAVVFDEAHTIEDEVVRFVGKAVRESHFEDTKLDPTVYDMKTLDGVLDMLADIRAAYGDRLKVAPDGHSSPEHIMRFKTMERRFDAITDLGASIRANKSNFVLQDPEYGNDGKFKVLSVMPLDVSKILPKMFGSGLNVFMSATIRPDIFAKSVGLSDWKSIEIRESPFPAGHRKVDFLNVARITFRSPPGDEVRVAAAVDKMISAHPGERGLILTSSKARCRRLLSRLSPENALRVSMAHSENEGGETVREIMKRHAATPDSILLSSSLWQGVDLKDDLSRFQIVEKCPWPFLGDKRVKALADRRNGWYEYQTVVKVLQGFGRSVRGMDDHAVTYVMDSAVNGLLKHCRHMVPPAYHDVVFN